MIEFDTMWFPDSCISWYRYDAKKFTASEMCRIEFFFVATQHLTFVNPVSRKTCWHKFFWLVRDVSFGITLVRNYSRIIFYRNKENTNLVNIKIMCLMILAHKINGNFNVFTVSRNWNLSEEHTCDMFYLFVYNNKSWI